MRQSAYEQADGLGANWSAGLEGLSVAGPVPEAQCGPRVQPRLRRGRRSSRQRDPHRLAAFAVPDVDMRGSATGRHHVRRVQQPRFTHAQPGVGLHEQERQVALDGRGPGVDGAQQSVELLLGEGVLGAAGVAM